MVGEAKLEMFLEENPPIEANIAKAIASLNEAKSYLTESISELSTQVLNIILLIKLQFVVVCLLNKM